MTSTACDDQFTERTDVPKKEQQVTSNFKEGIHRDRDYLDWLRTQPCFATDMETHDYETVDPAHTSVGGRGLKGPDKHALPLVHSLHLEGHNGGVTRMWCRVFMENPTVLNDLLSFYAENYYYAEYLKEMNDDI